MNFLKKNVERAQQSVSESLGSANKTEYDPDVQAIIANVEDIRLHTSALLAALKTNVQPDPTHDLISAFKVDSLNPPESLAKVAEQYAVKMETGHAATAQALNTLAAAYKTVGTAQRAYNVKTRDETLHHLKEMLEVDIAQFAADKAALHNKRLDLDSAKNKKTPDEAELAKCKTEFMARQDKVRQLGRAIIEKNGNELKAYLAAYLQAEIEYHQTTATKLAEARSAL